MSRIGRKEIAIPSGVTVQRVGGDVTVKGPRGELRRGFPTAVDLKVEGAKLKVVPTETTRLGRAVHGLARALLQNMVTGVSQGFRRRLEINGVGYRAEVQGTTIQFTLGYSHPIMFPLPPGLKASLEKNAITIEGADREILGETAARIRRLRPPEPYKGKGIKYAEEHIERKVGKTGATA